MERSLHRIVAHAAYETYEKTLADMPSWKSDIDSRIRQHPGKAVIDLIEGILREFGVQMPADPPPQFEPDKRVNLTTAILANGNATCLDLQTFMQMPNWQAEAVSRLMEFARQHQITIFE